MKFFTRTLFFVFLVARASALATELIEINQSIRSNGMGGVQVPFPSSTDAMFVNPAALSDVSGMHWEIVNLGMGINGLTIAQSLQASGNLNSTSALAAYMGKPVNLEVQGRSSFVLPHFGLAVYDDAHVGFELTNPAYPSLSMTYQNDYGVMMGTSFSSGPSSFGIVGKRINRLGGPSQTVGIGTAISPSTLTNSFKQAGVGYGLDVAYNYKFPMATTPTLSMVWHDLGDTQFVATDSPNAAPDHIVNNLIIGLGGTVDLPGLDMAYGLEYRHVQQNDIQLGKKLHFGGEVSLPFVDLRVGLNQGYAAYGVGFDMFLFKVDASMYSEETGEYAGQKPDSRVQVGMSLDIGFDADFSISSLTRDAKKRKLKQRR